MANNELNSNENILVKVDQNNLIYIDPNSVLDNNNQVQPRGIRPENLVIYANLEAELVPRSILAYDNLQPNLVSIADKNLNFLNNTKGRDYDSTWTDVYTTNRKDDSFEKNDTTGQSFGIESIQVIVKGANSIPTVTINFIDVRGKTLFESPENSPYQAFFHIPWPIFYLTLKGYYGKAIKYRLHLVKLSTKFNDSTGNFDTTGTFVGSTFAFLNDIPLKAMLNCPYMYLIKSPEITSTDGTNNKVEISASSRGYSILKNVYSEYKRKGLIKEDFPVKTLREVIVLAQSLDKLLEKEILNNVLDAKIFVGIKDLEERLVDFRNTIDSWQRKNLASTSVIIDGENYFNLKKLNDGSTAKVLGQDESTLESIVNKKINEIKKSTSFANEVVDKTKDAKLYGSDFKYEKIFTKPVRNVDFYVKSNEGTYVVNIKALKDDIYEAIKVFSTQRDKLVNQVEEAMNKIVKEGKGGFGFEPTIRNIFAVILANAEVYIRLMKDVHTKAFAQGNERAKKIDKLSNETKEDLPIYPWPEVKKTAQDEKNRVIAYPGDKDLLSILSSDDFTLWPEVQFIEEYIDISTNKTDTNIDKEFSTLSEQYSLPNDDNQTTKVISTLDYIDSVNSYIDIIPSSIFYEIWERANYYTFVDSFSSDTLDELSKIEFENIKNSIKENYELVDFFKNITSEQTLRDNLFKFSPYERYPYYQEQLPTIPYIKDALNAPFKIEDISVNNTQSTGDIFSKTESNLLNYTGEPYRRNIYPFNSATYLNYIKKPAVPDDEFKFQGNLFVDINNGFITSRYDPLAWIKTSYNKNNFLKQKLKIGVSESNILNTPYFHNQLYNDFDKITTYGKYAGSAYLFLNSLPFVDLEDKTSFTQDNKTYPTVRVSSLFREVGASHRIPFHLMCKWGAIYHRYKNFILTGEDILNGCLTTNNKTKRINTNLFFNNNETDTIYTAYTANNSTIILNNSTTELFEGDPTVHPFYDAIFHQVINDYNHYIVASGNTSFSENVTKQNIIMRKRNPNNNINYWTSFVDNSKYNSDTNYYTLLPCDGNQKKFKSLEDNLFGLQSYYKIIWDDTVFEDDYENKTFFKHDEYNLTYNENDIVLNKIYKIDLENRKIIDLIATFSPQILEEFENMFLNFASERLGSESTDSNFIKVKYRYFQDILKDIVTIDKSKINASYDITNQNGLSQLIDKLSELQSSKLSYISDNIFSDTNMIKFSLGNPKELDKYVLSGFVGIDSVNRFNVDEYNSLDLNTKNKSLIKLYIGEDIDNYYQDFFIYNNIKLNEENILTFRPLIQIYAGYVKAGNSNSSQQFKDYLKNQIILGNNAGSAYRLTKFLNNVVQNFSTLELPKIENKKTVSGHNNNDMKLELYNYFKSFNDKWAAGNSIGNRLLLEEFLFLDKANKDIGDKLYLNLDRLIDLGNPKNDKQNLYGVISILIQGTGVDMRPLPAYVNFYNTEYNARQTLTPSSKVANNIFGTFLDVDYEEASPKIILQLVGKTSNYLDILNSKFKFNDDSFYIGNINNNPLVYTLPENIDNTELSKSNKVVAFEVNFGDQNQGIFKNISLDQSSIKNTTESFVVLENIAKSESGAAAHNVDIGLFDYYRQASYTCDVTSMGNAMIQPTMFFYLNNIPMFRGSYWISEVTHSIKGNSFTTTFKGTRIPRSSLPDPKDSFLSSYRVLFDKILNKVLTKNRTETLELNSTVKTVFSADDGKTYKTDLVKLAKNEDYLKIKLDKAGLNKYFVPYNGFISQIQHIQLVKYNFNNTGEKEWLRGIVVEMGGKNQPIADDYKMTIASKLTNVTIIPWKEISQTSKSELFYQTKVNSNFTYGNKKLKEEDILNLVTTFVNPENGNSLVIGKFSISGAVGNRKVSGLIDSGPYTDPYSVGLSRLAMQRLKINDGDVIYFLME